MMLSYKYKVFSGIFPKKSLMPSPGRAEVVSRKVAQAPLACSGSVSALMRCQSRQSAAKVSAQPKPPR